MEGLDESLVMAQAALGVKNKAIDMLCEELQGLRQENDDLFRAVMQVPSTNSSSTAATGQLLSAGPSSNPAASHPPPPPPHPAAAEARASALGAAAAEAAALKRALQQAEQQRAAAEAQAQRLAVELAESRQLVRALEAELQDTMDAAMQLWDTVQAGTLSEGSASRPASLYQEQLSPLSPFPAAAAADGCGGSDGFPDILADQQDLPWRTPSASPDALEPCALTPPAAAATAAAGAAAAAAAAAAADVTPRGARDRDAAAAAAAAAAASGLSSDRLAGAAGVGAPGDGPESGQLPAAGLFTPIELRVHSLASKLRTYMLRQPGLAPPASPLGTAGHSTGGSPQRTHKGADSPITAAAAAAVAADVSAARQDQA